MCIKAKELKDILNNIDDETEIFIDNNFLISSLYKIEINTSESMGTVSPCIILIGAKQTAQHIMRNINILMEMKNEKSKI